MSGYKWEGGRDPMDPLVNTPLHETGKYYKEKRFFFVLSPVGP